MKSFLACPDISEQAVSRSPGKRLCLLSICAVLCKQEDDEFEEFEQQEWPAGDEDIEDPTLWQDGWEDDEDDDNFTKQLRAELNASEASSKAGETMQD